MNQKDILEKINFINKFQTETVNLETKAAKIDYPKKCYDTISSFSNNSSLLFEKFGFSSFILFIYASKN